MSIYTQQSSRWLQWSSFMLFLAVALGAFGAHSLQDSFNAHQLDVWQKAVNYQVIHGIALLAMAMAIKLFARQMTVWIKAAWSFLAGIVLFSGSLYLWALTGIKFLVFLTPIGGSAFLLGWIFVFLGARQLGRST